MRMPPRAVRYGFVTVLAGAIAYVAIGSYYSHRALDQCPIYADDSIRENAR